MGWLGGSDASDNAQPQMSDDDFRMAKMNLTATSGLFSSAFELCQQKCLQPREDFEKVSAHEALCIDKCVAKFFVMMPKVNEICQEHQQRKMGAQ